ncbi:hypothetical protein BGX38DRAFT_1102446 [Terfezia claveryi]|nr:hypothetical protein BGX38DRAFT_1102446 [Terfezia claveryi]
MADVESVDSNQKAPLKRKRPNVKGNYGDYPADCHKTLNSNERSYFKPCLHTGPCNSECPCVKDKVMCEKTCMCDADCPRKWRGCKCIASGKACSITTACPCARWNRECDPDLCSGCGAAETLSPTNRYDLELAKECCQNVVIQRDIPKRTLLGVSGVSGLGLFIGENVKKDGFLGEYKGEIISNDEAERRGKLYDRRGVSFLFTLNKTQVIDATRAGNKFRFVNHYKKPNCFARVLFTNCTHRIGMFAKRDLVAGEELYFDYG